ncbi:6,7-dimethyl-8-ribityllumazine synthase [Pleomorphomonas sp. JP5]|uniref:6,7-dimethyl-8-ribityllumazine synthase n=1 Tax=Pleomorphomonas sp. JP5 TaxID=2942998 RepID=UPI0020437DCE|nr:6,7-dimethyl-8-ribityllumazine synthase [Pleomorphomonas sp. JP5]MCM5560226.1 6,7-dimethyl-8-ribityllumazine synthase [Pleomorphomonas sp. JP5]
MTKSPTPPRLAVVVSRFNPEVTEGLLAGTRRELDERGVPLADADVFHAPGAFEIPLLAQTLAKTGRYAGVICLGCVIKGDTAHFEFISLGAATGLMQATLATGVPITFGILTTYTDEQALLRSRDDAANKGREAAAACVEALATIVKIRAA